MMRLDALRWCALIAAVLISGCESGKGIVDPDPEPAKVAVGLVLSHGTINPGESLTVTVEVTPLEGAELQFVRITVSGSFVVSDSVPLYGRERQTLHRHYDVPLNARAGDVVFTATAGAAGTSASVSATLTVNEHRPPNILSLRVEPNRDVVPGDTVTVTYSANSVRGISVVRVTLPDNTAFITDSVLHAGEKNVVGTLRIRTSSYYSYSTWVSLEVRDLVGQEQRTTETIHLHMPPSLGGYVSSGFSNPELLPGDTLLIRAGASSAVHLTWVGYSIGAPIEVSDSIAVTGTETSQLFQRVVDERWISRKGYGPAVHIFARDTRGARHEITVGEARVSDAVRRPTRSVFLPEAVFDAVLDARRNLVYLSVPARNQIAVLSLEAMTFGPPIRVPTPMGLDLTPGGDSLVVALRRDSAIAVVDLGSGVRTDIRLGWIDLHLPLPGPENVRVAANSKVFVSLTFSGSGYGGKLIEYDLATGSQRWRQEPGGNGMGMTTDKTVMARSGNGAKILVTEQNSCCPMYGLVYDAATDEFSPRRGVLGEGMSGAGGAGIFDAPVSGDATGSRFLAAVRFLRADLSAFKDIVGTPFTTWGYGSDASVIAPDGTTLFLGTEVGYWWVRESDSAVLERVWLDSAQRPVKLLIHPNMRMLISLTDSRAFVIDLH